MELEPIGLDTDRSEGIYRQEDCRALLKTYEAYYQEIGFNPPWTGYFVVREGQVVGACGFTGQPKKGRVEIAYWTFEGYERQGISSFACRALVSICQQADPSITITAKTAPEHNASTKILGNTGFTFAGIVEDDDIGNAWSWMLKCKRDPF